jgi:hypothetical protein
MTFVAGAVIWAGYTLGWWGWLAVTDRVPAGQPGSFWWPSIRDLVAPGAVGRAVPPRLIAVAQKTKQDAQSLPNIPGTNRPDIPGTKGASDPTLGFGG